MIKDSLTKKITALTLSLAVGTMSVMSASAGSGFDFEPCPNCGDGSVWHDESEVARFGVDQDECAHKRFGVDVLIGIHYVHTYTCVDCHYGWTDDSYDYYWDCQGYDDPLEQGN